MLNAVLSLCSIRYLLMIQPELHWKVMTWKIDNKVQITDLVLPCKNNNYHTCKE